VGGSCYPSLLGTGEAAPGIVHPVEVPSSPRRTWRNLEKVQQKPPEADRGMEHTNYEERLVVELGVCSLA